MSALTLSQSFLTCAEHFSTSPPPTGLVKWPITLSNTHLIYPLALFAFHCSLGADPRRLHGCGGSINSWGTASTAANIEPPSPPETPRFNTLRSIAISLASSTSTCLEGSSPVLPSRAPCLTLRAAFYASSRPVHTQTQMKLSR
jgi:hypothetical protein